MSAPDQLRQNIRVARQDAECGWARSHDLDDRLTRAVRVLRHWHDALESGEQEAITAESLDCLADALEWGFGQYGGAA